ncbi:DUF803-domain-containing protein [Hymenopellis radicata]|nr:DUF803-domain-containing protein [Hymenopellis radicata]
MSSSASASATASAASATSSATSTTTSSNLKIVGIILAVISGFLIGSSFVFKKKGLLRSQAGGTAGEGVAYLKSVLWWTGMIMMILGELCNSAAYAFVEAIVVTPLGALSVVICAILSSIFLKETLSLFGWLGCALCILGSVVIALNGPSEDLVGQIREFQKLFLAPGFLAYIGVLITASLVIIFYFAPRYGKQSMLWYIFVCSMIGGISVSVTTGLGAAIVTTAKGDNQFKYWFMYFLLVFVAVTLITEVYYLNKALALYNTAMVTPTYYVIFTFFSMVTTIVLFQGLDSTPAEIITIVMGFLVICVGITILQLSKIDPTTLNKLDRRSTLLLQAARTKPEDMEEKSVAGMEDPGMDALRGSFGAVGSIIRARRMSQSSRVSYRTGRPPGAAAPFPPNQPYQWPEAGGDSTPKTALDHLSGVERHQLYDAPVPRSNTGGSFATASVAGATKGDDGSSIKAPSVASSNLKRPTIKFDNTDLVHQYHPTGQGRSDSLATHEHRLALGNPGLIMPGGGTGNGYTPPESGYPPAIMTESPPTKSNDNLLGDSPTAITIPHGVAFEHTVQSAPPTINPRYARPGGQRVDSRDVFTQPSPQSTTSSTTLLSFPSITDSARSWDHEVDEHGKGDRGRTSRRYPRGDGDIDREESVSLVQRNARDDSDDSLTNSRGGIRLVQPSVPSEKF